MSSIESIRYIKNKKIGLVHKDDGNEYVTQMIQVDVATYKLYKFNLLNQKVKCERVFSKERPEKCYYVDSVTMVIKCAVDVDSSGNKIYMIDMHGYSFLHSGIKEK
jgi:hypothetical protein